MRCRTQCATLAHLLQVHRRQPYSQAGTHKHSISLLASQSVTTDLCDTMFIYFYFIYLKLL